MRIMRKTFIPMVLCLFLIGGCANSGGDLQNGDVSTSQKNHQNLENTQENNSIPWKTETYFSSSSKQNLPYLILLPNQQGENQTEQTSMAGTQSELANLKIHPVGLLIYMHGAGGGMEQGMSDTLYKGNFKKLKNLLAAQNFIYVTPSTTDFEKNGGNDLNDLAQELKKKYPGIPLYLAGASAGGRTVYYALQNGHNYFSGVVLLCPALSKDLIEHKEYDMPKIWFWIVQGDEDQSVSPEVTDLFASNLQHLGLSVVYKKIKGDHNAPVEEVDWKEALQFLWHAD